MGLVSAAIGLIGTIYSSNQQRKNFERQEERLEEQAEAAETAARNDLLVGDARDDTGADIELGRGAATTTDPSAASSQTAATSRNGSVKKRVGGLSGGNRVRQEIGL